MGESGRLALASRLLASLLLLASFCLASRQHLVAGHIISDGGVTVPGDAAKAFGAGADFVMAGGMFAGHDESGGEITVKPDGKKAPRYRRDIAMPSAS